MKGIEFDGQTRMLNPPRGWDQSQGLRCGMLPVRDGELAGMHVMYSFWQPTVDDLEALAKGACVRLCVVSEVHPPVALEVMKCEPLG